MLRLAPLLRVLDELARHDGHVTRAADALDIPQSSMSRRIHALENETGIRLLVPDGRAARLTPRAMVLAGHVRGPLRELEQAIGAIVTESDPEHGTVRLGFPLTMGRGVMPALIVDFHRRHPGVSLRLKQAHGSELAEDLRTGVLDVAVVIPAPADVGHVVIGHQEICACLPGDHRLAGRERVRLSDLSDEPFVVTPPAYQLRRLTETWCAEAGFRPNVAVEVTEFATAGELVGRGLGVALLPRGHVVRGAVEITLGPGERQRPIALAWGPTSRTPAGRLVCDHIRGRFAGSL